MGETKNWGNLVSPGLKRFAFRFKYNFKKKMVQLHV